MDVELPVGSDDKPPGRQPREGVRSYSTDPAESEERKLHLLTVENFITLAKKRFRTVESAERLTRDEQRKDMEWRAGGDYHWDDRARTERQNQSRPWMTINKFPEAIHQIVNSERMTKGAVQVSAVDDGAVVQTAEVLQGIIRHIEDKSSAAAIYTNAAMWQATIGRGYWRIVTESAGPRSFAKQIRMKRVRNPFQVYCDPAAQEPDFRDIRYCFIVTDMPGDQYDQKFGKDARAALNQFQTLGDDIPDRAPEGTVRVMEYFYVNEIPDTLLRLEARDENTLALIEESAPDLLEPIFESELPPDWRGNLPAGLAVAEREPKHRREVRWALIDSQKILVGNQGRDFNKNTEGRLWDGKWIPIVQVVGDEIDLDGEVDYRGVVRDGRDPQRVYNFMVTSEIEMIQTSKTAPWVGYAGQFKGHERKWATANVRHHPYLEVNATPGPNGQPLPLPQRAAQEPPIVAINAAIQQADADFKTVTRWHDASLGQRGPQESGVAIERRQRQDQQSNSHFPDNMNLAKKFFGDLLIDLIPKTYDTPRIMKILGDDESPKTVQVHGGNVPEGFPLRNYGQAELPEGIEGIYDLSVGTYDVAVSVGPSYQSQRQETVEHLTTLFAQQPQLFQMYADIYYDALDSPVAQRLSNRAKRMLPVDFQDQEGEEQLSPQTAQKLDQLSAELETAKQQLATAVDQLRVDQIRADNAAKMKDADNESKERLAAAQRESQQIKDEADRKVKVLELQLEHQGRLSLQRVKDEAQIALKQVTSKLEEQIAGLKVALETGKSLTEIEAEKLSQMEIDEHAAGLLPPSPEGDERKVVI